MIRFRSHKHTDTQINVIADIQFHCFAFFSERHSFKLKAAYQPIKIINYFTDQIIYIRNSFLCWMAKRCSVWNIAWAIVVSIWPFYEAQRQTTTQNIFYNERTSQPASQLAFVMDTGADVVLSSALNTIWHFANPFEWKQWPTKYEIGGRERKKYSTGAQWTKRATTKNHVYIF